MSLVTAAKQRWFLTFDEIIVFTSPPRHRRNGHCRCKGLAKSSWSMTHSFGLLKDWDNSPSNKNKERMATSAVSLSQRPYYWLSDSLKSQPSWPKVVKSVLMEHINIPGVCLLSWVDTLIVNPHCYPCHPICYETPYLLLSKVVQSSNALPRQPTCFPDNAWQQLVNVD